MHDSELRRISVCRWAADTLLAISLLGAVVTVYLLDTPKNEQEVGRSSELSGVPSSVDPIKPSPSQADPTLELSNAEAPPVIGEFDDFPVARLASEGSKVNAAPGGDVLATSMKPQELDALALEIAKAEGPKVTAAEQLKIAPEAASTPATNAATVATKPTIASVSPPTLRALAPRNRLDDVVDRFIAYDIGQLPGLEGTQANQEFNRLGPEAIDALVRGLNRSASISASCPVIVLQSKLSSLLSLSRDPHAVERAMQNIGDGVPATAPHSARLASYRNQLIRQLPEDHPVRLHVERSQRLLTARNDTVIDDALKSADHEERRAAAHAASAMGVRFGKQLIQLLGDSNAEVRQEARQGLIRISGNTDFGPNEPATPETSARAVAKWDKWWGAQVRNNVPNAIWRASTANLKGLLKHKEDRVRFAAVMVIRSKGLRLFEELVGLLRDPDPLVRREAHQTLVELAKGENFGPADFSNQEELATAIAGWSRWYARQKVLSRYSSLTSSQVLQAFKNTGETERWAAVATVRRRRLRVGDDLIGMLSDTSLEVRQEARHALIQIADGSDFGPSESADEEQRRDAITQWTTWWQKLPKTETQSDAQTRRTQG